MINIETILNLVQFLAMIVFGYSILLFLIEEKRLKNLPALDKTILSLGIGFLALILLSFLISDMAVTSGIIFSVGGIFILIVLIKRKIKLRRK